MDIENNPDKGVRVWLNPDELEQFSEFYSAGCSEWVSINLLGKCGLKLNETVSLRRSNIQLSGYYPTIRLSGSGSRPNLRECPIPKSVAYAVSAYDSGEILEVTGRTVQRWIGTVGEELADKDNNSDWEKVSALDLRRSWADILLLEGVPAGVVMQWGGWENLETFQEMYLSRHSVDSSIEMVEKSDLFD